VISKSRRLQLSCICSRSDKAQTNENTRCTVRVIYAFDNRVSAHYATWVPGEQLMINQLLVNYLLATYIEASVEKVVIVVV